MVKLDQESQPLTLEYDLYDLPTAQHKAGLAGLLLMVESMKNRRMTPLPDVKYDSTKATVSFTKESFQAVFNDLYDASWIEKESKTKRKNKKKEVIEPIREFERESTTKDGKKRKEKFYIYRDYKPRGTFLSALLPADSELWLKLWREMLWGTLRVRPTTRKVYEERANGKPSSEAKKIWETLTKAVEHSKKGRTLTGSIVSSVFIGAQDRNAENVPFQGEVEQNLLLHFWTIASLIFVPRLIKKNDKSKQYQMEPAGYVLAVPEPARLQDFVIDALSLLRSLEVERSGFRPRFALVSVPEESGLEYCYRLAGSRVSRKEISYSLAAVEIYHLEKRGNNTETLANTRISPDERILKDYDGLRKKCRNPLFRSQRIRNLLSQEQWYTGVDSLFSRYPLEFFVFSQEKTPGTIPFFGYDARAMFDDIQGNLNNAQKGGNFMSEGVKEGVKDNRLATIVNRLVRAYVNHRTEEKSGEKYENFKNKKDDKGHIIYPPKYRGAREDICRDAFLAMRSRREQDFVDYFTGTICSVAQYLPEEEYLIVSQELLNRPDAVKTLSMLALSASSYAGKTIEEGEEQ